MTFHVDWIDSGREPQHPPDPVGIDIDTNRRQLCRPALLVASPSSTTSNAATARSPAPPAIGAAAGTPNRTVRNSRSSRDGRRAMIFQIEILST